MTDLNLYNLLEPISTSDWSYIKPIVARVCGGGNEQYEIMYDIARYGDGDEHCMEIGSFYGAGVSAMAIGAKLSDKNKCISLDFKHQDWTKDHGFFKTQHLIEHGPGEMFQYWYNLTLMDVHDWIILITEDSMIAHKWLDIPLRLLHVDANHDLIHVLNDIKHYGKMLVSGGIICFQNGREHSEWDAIEEMIINSGDYTNYDFCHNYKCLGEDGKTISASNMFMAHKK